MSCYGKKKESPKEMTPNAGEPLGMERDNKGRAIPLKDRLPEDRAKAKSALIRRKRKNG
jgi:hypothetical protein